ncbi:DNA cytosine methyltransferase [Nostoc sp. CHAB 5784]|uniref:DNA cytosine methyltransferase n=1 Tax=Nostoc mirabile TaxID=2907820 RepID=UPI001E32B077|nr:DNA cytosine methyltransferase [Nostoc mirabile]MCC5669632.1 DNA cytosine methyltransferase [Nostoc mirabile CHAB5784]
MQPTISIPQHWGYPRFALEQRTQQGIIAGLPCPPFSLAGKRLASQDERNLFGEFFRILRCVRPHWAIVENVPGLITAEGSGFFRTVLWEFAQMGFDVQWGVLSANQVGAVHKRERVWIIATDSQSSRWRTSRYKYPQAGTNIAFVGCGNHCNFQRSSQNDNSVEYGARAIAQCTSSGGDDGFPAMLDGCLLTHTGLTNWLCAATIPSFNRLTRTEIAIREREPGTI